MSISAPAPDASGHIAKPADIESLARVTAEAYGRTFVADYDGWYAGLPDTGAAVSTLDRLAGSGPVLELGVGTGRLAMPLARLGHQVTGIDVSAEMLDRLRSKDLAGTVATRQADIADFRIEQRYSLIYAAFNTLLCLTSADRQRSCLQRCADQLAPDGRLVLEYMVIPPSMPAGLGGPHPGRVGGLAADSDQQALPATPVTPSRPGGDRRRRPVTDVSQRRPLCPPRRTRRLRGIGRVEAGVPLAGLAGHPRRTWRPATHRRLPACRPCAAGSVRAVIGPSAGGDG